MARVNGQSLPSLLEFLYKHSLTAENTRHRVSKRVSIKIPKLKITKEKGTKLQKQERAIFKKCTECWKRQRDTTTVETYPDGTKSRGWWFTNNPYSDLFYFDYFMKETLLAYLSGTPPTWCPCDAGVKQFELWQDYLPTDDTFAAYDNDGPVTRNFFNTPRGRFFRQYNHRATVQYFNGYDGIYITTAKTKISTTPGFPLFPVWLVYEQDAWSHKFFNADNGNDTLGTMHYLGSQGGNYRGKPMTIGRCSFLRVFFRYDYNNEGMIADGAFPTGSAPVKIANMPFCFSISIRAGRSGPIRHVKISVVNPFNDYAPRQIVTTSLDYSSHDPDAPNTTPDAIASGLIQEAILGTVFYIDIPLFGIGDITQPLKKYLPELEFSVKTGYFMGEQGLDTPTFADPGYLQTKFWFYGYSFFDDLKI